MWLESKIQCSCKQTEVNCLPVWNVLSYSLANLPITAYQAMRQSAALLRWFTFLQLPWRPLLHLSFSIKIWKFFPFIIKSYAHAINDSMQQEFPYYSLKQDIFVYFFTLSTLSPPLPPIYQLPQVMGKSSCCREAVEVNLHINSWKYRTTSVTIKPLMEGALFFLVNFNMFWFDLLTKCRYV